MAKKMTIKDIARECGVSITTVSRVLNNKEGCCTAETEKKILDAVAMSNYHPNPAARSLVTKRTNIIGVVLPDIYNYFFQEFFKGAEDYLSSHGYCLILCNTDGKAKKESDFLQSLSLGIVDGIMVTTENYKEDNTKILELVEEGFPVVTVERYGKELDDIPKILFDNKRAVELAIECLFQKGHRRIAFIKGPEQAYNALLRYDGYIEGLKKMGLELVESLVCQGDYKLPSGYGTIKKLLAEEKFTAIVASNDLMAVGACKAVREAGKKVPDDISVIGFDGTVLAEMHQPELSTIEVKGYKMGQVSAENLLKLIKGEEVADKKVVIEPVLRQGESVKKLN